MEERKQNITQSDLLSDDSSNENNAQKVEKPVKKKAANIFWNIFLIVVIAIGILSLFGIVKELDPQSGASFGEVMSGASPAFIAVLVLVIVLTMACDVGKYCIITKTVTGRMRLATSVKTHFLGKYYDAVTPFSTGGQPMQIYYLNTKGISGGNSTAIVLIRYYSSVLCWITLGGILMAVGAVNGVLNDVSVGTVLKVTGWIGIAINLIIPLFVTLFLILPRFMQKLTEGIVKLGKKLRIVKDAEKTTAKATRVVSDFKQSFKLMATSPVKLILLILVSFGEVFLTFATPFFVMKALSCPVDGMIIDVMALNAFATFGVSFVPTPGNSGVVEGMGARALSVAAGSALVWSVLVWRLSVFYLYILIGLGITVFDVICRNVAAKRRAKV
ncbi:MAG: flippase-like domain-containing protein [Clostridia bacterium]|nr:flippase-like domain-containing protein [Clostridia bacterium]